LLEKIDNLISISRIKANQIHANFKEITLNDLLPSISDMAIKYKRRYVCESVELVIHKPSELVTLKTDKLLVTQVLSPIIQNAFKFTSSGKIEIGFNVRNADYAIIYVADTGTGIYPQFQKKIFDYFSKPIAENQTDSGGIGLGLAIAIGLIKLLGGKIDVESVPGKGSTFFIIIPV
jgi:signal transduction histidine kinase